jgi:prolyl oligopeptidase
MKNKILICCLLATQQIMAQINEYPVTRKDATEDNYFGTIIKDPYRWLEDDTSSETAEWVKQQNIATQNELRQIPFKDALKTNLTKLWNYTKYGSPFKKGAYYYYYKNDGLQNQSILYRQKGLTGAPEVFLDPNTLSKDGTAALGDLSFSKNKKYCAFTVGLSGSDWQDIYVMDVATKKLVADKITYTKFSGVAWKGDAGFYYSGYTTPASEEKKFSVKSEFQKVMYHSLGAKQTDDKLVYEDTEHPLIYKSAGLTDDERFLILYLSEGTDGTEIQYIDLLDKTNKSFKKLLPGYEYNYSIIDNIGGQLLCYTNQGASNYQLVLVDPKNPEFKNWKKIIPESENKLDGINIVGNQILAHYLVDASTTIKRFDMTGKYLGNIPSPGIGTMAGFDGDKKDVETFYSFSSFNMPTTIYRYDIIKNKSEVFKKVQTGIIPEDFIVKQVKFKSKDGTMVPMFIVHRKDVSLSSGANPVLMYGYGGFNISLTPSFSIPNIYFVQQGGVYVLVNLRGGSEYGEAWHSAGMLDKKQNVFDDFIGAAEYLIANKITNPKKIAIKGGSNGGLLVGACMTQRPDLFKVALPGVGVLDMLRYHKFTVGWGWAVEYGSSEKQTDFDYLIKYSPLHNVKNNANYPATLITTADHDDRVVPAHSFKFAATLQEKNLSGNPLLIRIDSKAGHGAGKPTSKQIDEWADVLSFTMFHLGMWAN